jgi:hypothetical protein
LFIRIKQGIGTGQPGDIFSAAAFMASNDAGWMTDELFIASNGPQVALVC